MKLNKNTISKPEFVRPLVRGEETIKTIFKQPYARSHAGWMINYHIEKWLKLN